jgi:hypothetical protein
VLLLRQLPERRNNHFKYENMGFGGTSLSGLLLALMIYILPSVIALFKNHQHKKSIILLNLVGGLLLGTGWLLAFIWCFISGKRE